MTYTQIKNNRNYAHAYRMASFVFLGLAVALLLVSSIVRFWLFEMDPITNSPMLSDSILYLVSYFSYFGLIFFIAFVWLYVLYLRRNKRLITHKPIYVAGNLLLLIGMIMASFMSLFMINGVPAITLCDYFVMNHWAIYGYFSKDLVAAKQVRDQSLFLILFSVIGFTVLICGLAMVIYSIVDKATRHKRFFMFGAVLFVIAAILLSASVFYYLIDGFRNNVSFLQASLAPAKWLTTNQFIYCLLSVVGFVSMIGSFILLILSAQYIVGVHRRMCVASLIVFILMAVQTIIFIVLFLTTDYRFWGRLGSIGYELSLDTIYYSVYNLFLVLSMFSAASVLLSFGDTFKKPIVQN